MVILLFWFWLSVRNGLYFVFGFGFLYIFYFTLAIIAWHPPFYSVFPFYLAPLFYSVSPFYSVIKDQFIFICHPFAPAATATAAPTLTASSRPRPRPRPRLSIDRRLFVPAKCVRIKKLCKTHYKCYYTTMIYAPVFYTPHYCTSSYPSKKKTTIFYPLRI